MEDEWTALEYFFFSKNKKKLFLLLNMVVFPELALVHKGARQVSWEGVSFFGEGTGEEPYFRAGLWGAVVTFERSSRSVLGPDDLKGAGGPELGPNRRYLWFSHSASAPYATHQQQGREAVGAEELTGPGGQPGLAGRQHSPSGEAV